VSIHIETHIYKLMNIYVYIFKLTNMLYIYICMCLYIYIWTHFTFSHNCSFLIEIKSLDFAFHLSVNVFLMRVGPRSPLPLFRCVYMSSHCVLNPLSDEEQYMVTSLMFIFLPKKKYFLNVSIVMSSNITVVLTLCISKYF